MIKPPFRNYHRAELERLVQEGWDELERQADFLAREHSQWGVPQGQPLSDYRFQVLVAADAFLRATTPKTE